MSSRSVAEAEEITGRRVAEALGRVRSSLGWILRAHGVDEDLAQDILQDVAVLALQKYQSIRDLEGWLVGVTWRRCIMHFRELRSHPWVALVSHTVPKYLATQEREQLVRELKSLCPTRYCVVLDLVPNRLGTISCPLRDLCRGIALQH